MDLSQQMHMRCLCNLILLHPEGLNKDISWAMEHAQLITTEQLDGLGIPSWDVVGLSDIETWGEPFRVNDALRDYRSRVYLHELFQYHGEFPHELTPTRIVLLRVLHHAAERVHTAYEHLVHARDCFLETGDLQAYQRHWSVLPPTFKSLWISDFGPGTVATSSHWSWQLYLAGELKRPNISQQPAQPLSQDFVQTSQGLLQWFDQFHGVTRMPWVEELLLALPRPDALCAGRFQVSKYWAIDQTGRLFRLFNGSLLDNNGPRCSFYREIYPTEPHPGGWVEITHQGSSGRPPEIAAHGPGSYKKLRRLQEIPSKSGGITVASLSMALRIHVRDDHSGLIALRCRTARRLMKTLDRFLLLDDSDACSQFLLMEHLEGFLRRRLSKGQMILPVRFEPSAKEMSGRPVLGRFVRDDRATKIQMVTVLASMSDICHDHWEIHPDIPGVQIFPFGDDVTPHYDGYAANTGFLLIVDEGTPPFEALGAASHRKYLNITKRYRFACGDQHVICEDLGYLRQTR